MKPEELTGQIHSHLTQVSTLHQTLLTEQKVHHDLIALVNSAYASGFELTVASGFRDFSRQLQIWNHKFTGLRPILDSDSQPLDPLFLSGTEKMFAILRWSALPGASRHHWGTDFDIYARNLLPKDQTLHLEPWEYLSGHQYEFYCWLNEHLTDFGFFFPYARDLGGVAPEPWHISHRLRSQDYMAACTPALLTSVLESADIAGKEVILHQLADLYTRYITNICQPD
ncbi:peptidase M15 [Vibrio sp. HA2012]|uniref:M15 family metallopeptidase n=1 Tax=Vibrio sp. HA2012 TaxID=1971595 RepID=UPI000C2BB316|nr:M15 family metallopeptidase [Vibrio sp. HA2012]PJC86580.1 peptidase M15 [Vibrio sp. HA2012]